MKRFLLLSLIALLCLPALAQPKITCGVLNLTVSVKRCFVQGDMAYPDLLLTNTSDKDMTLFVLPERATDDEGCSYVNENGTRVYLILDGRGERYYNYFIPAEGFIRIRVAVKGLDEYATAFQYLGLMVDPSGHDSVSGRKPLIIRNIPITRE